MKIRLTHEVSGQKILDIVSGAFEQASNQILPEFRWRATIENGSHYYFNGAIQREVDVMIFLQKQNSETSVWRDCLIYFTASPDEGLIEQIFGPIPVIKIT
ncbi:MAG: hypothetical protein Q8Q23_04220 [bacterium]|nr:hypothetical protein [bacterium]